MKKYENYRKIGLPWLAYIPSHWKSLRNKNIFTEQKEVVGENFKNYTLLSLTLNGIVPRNMDAGGKFPESFDKYKIVKKGNIAFCLFDIDETPRTVGVSEYDGMLTNAYTIMAIRKINGRYIYYYYLALDNEKMLKPLYTGLRKTIGIDTFQSMKIPVPPRAEQEQIVRFLDWKVSEINKLIGIRKKEVVAIKELNEAIIEKAITIGIDEVTVFKFTGLHYLPEIPDAWELLKLKHVCKVGASITKKLKQYADQDMVVFLPMENISVDGEIDCSMKVPLGKVKSGFSSFAKGDVIVAKITPCFENGKGACLNALESEIGYGTTELFNLRPFNNILSEYLYYVTKTKLFRVLGEGRMTGSAGQKRVPGEFIKNFIIGIPPIKEQQKIINYILQKTNDLKKQIEIKIEQIQQLLELKNTIISDVVTGKIDVRNVAIPEYEHIDDTADAAGGEERAEKLAEAEEMEA